MLDFGRSSFVLLVLLGSVLLVGVVSEVLVSVRADVAVEVALVEFGLTAAELEGSFAPVSEDLEVTVAETDLVLLA